MYRNDSYDCPVELKARIAKCETLADLIALRNEVPCPAKSRTSGERVHWWNVQSVIHGATKRTSDEIYVSAEEMDTLNDACDELRAEGEMESMWR